MKKYLVVFLLIVLGCEFEDSTIVEKSTIVQSIEEEDSNVYPALEPSIKAARQQEVDQFMSERSMGWDIVDTRETDDGVLVDYVRADTLYPGDPTAPFEEPPPSLPETTDNGDIINEGLADNEDWVLTEFQTNPNLQSPENTMPVIRPSFEKYINGEIDSSIDTLDKYISSTPKPRPQGVLNDRLYVFFQHDQSQYGHKAISGHLNVYKPQDASRDDFSLTQAGVFSEKRKYTVEAGILRGTGVFNDHELRFFTFFTTMSYLIDQDYLGGYSHHRKGFIQYRYAPFPPGSKITRVSQIGQIPQKVCQIKIQLYKNNWWVYGCTGWLGYYPTRHSSSLSYDKRIDFDVTGRNIGLSIDAHGVAFYGETFDDDPDQWMPFDMGSGQVLTTGVFAQDAYVRNLFLGERDPNNWNTPIWKDFKNVNDPPFVSNYLCYNGTQMKTSNNPSWRRHFYYGGPGRNSLCYKIYTNQFLYVLFFVLVQKLSPIIPIKILRQPSVFRRVCFIAPKQGHYNSVV